MAGAEAFEARRPPKLTDDGPGFQSALRGAGRVEGERTDHTLTFFLGIADRHDKFFPQFHESFPVQLYRQNYLASELSSCLTL
jgi:hypothetical protein